MHQNMEMELDYRIEFPSTLNQNINSVENGNENLANEKMDNSKPSKIWPIPGYENKDVKADGSIEKEVVVVLLGWAGSQHQHLSKYSDIYLSRGCIVLRYIAPVKALFVQCSQLPILGNRLVRLLKDLQLDSHPLFFHVFSNGGAFMYSYVLNELESMEKSEKFDIRGTIFDSCPAPRHLGKCFHAISNIFANFKLFRYIVASLVIVMLVFQIFWYHLKTAMKLCIFGEPLNELLLKPKHNDEIPLKDWLGRLCKMRNHSFLFLYSDADDLIPWNQVEEIADIAVSHGNKVDKKKFLGSEHVQHYRKYPKEYIEAVTGFIRQEMKIQKEPTVLWRGH